MNPFRLSWFKDTKRMVSAVCKFGWGMFWAVYVGLVLFGLFVSALMLGGYMINRIADEPLVVKESLNFDYTKNSPEAYVPISSCAGVDCDGSCKESNEMSKIRGLRVVPKDQKLDITLSMTLPESAYNKNLGMFQVLALAISTSLGIALLLWLMIMFLTLQMGTNIANGVITLVVSLLLNGPANHPSSSSSSSSSSSLYYKAFICVFVTLFVFMFFIPILNVLFAS